MASSRRSTGIDQKIVTLLRARDPRGLELLLSTHGGRVTQRLKHDFGRWAEACFEDAFWVATERLWNKFAQFDEERGSIGGWFYSIVYGEVLKRLRQEVAPQDQVASSEELEPEGIPVGHSQVGARAGNGATQNPPPSRAAFLAALAACIDELSPLKQAIIRADLREGKGESANSIQLAKTHSTSANTIRASRFQARKQLRDCMQSKGFFLDEPQSRPPAKGDDEQEDIA